MTKTQKSARYSFPEGLYTDVRIEHVFQTAVDYTKREMEDIKEAKYSAAFVRVYDGKMWYYASTSNLEGIQREIDALAAMAQVNPDLADVQVYKNLIPHQDEVVTFFGREAWRTPLEEKIRLVQGVMPLMEDNDYIKMWRIFYRDEYVIKEFYSSKGACLKFDHQQIGFTVSFTMQDGDRQVRRNIHNAGLDFKSLHNYAAKIEAEKTKCQDFLLNSVAVEPGKYSVIFSPLVTGVFVHECFGHKSESDFMLGDEATRKEWEIGKRVGPDELSIIETGKFIGSGYVPYDDEGNKAGVTYLVKNGILSGRLHNAETAADLGEEVTGNARAMNFEFEPIVRMTTTYIDAGSKTLDELIAETKSGIILHGFNHGQGMSTFTIAPRLAYYIKDGKIAEPVRVSVVSGNVFEALGDIDGITNTVEIEDNTPSLGGCGKMSQYPLRVGLGGPYIRVKNMTVS